MHALHFIDQNRVIASGDSDGWVIIWSIITKRALLAWKAHEGAILGLSAWTEAKLFTHGRDNRLSVWDIDSKQYEAMPAMLPIDRAEAKGRKPWLLHSLTVNALNFCPFTWCPVLASEGRARAEIIVAVPASKDSNAIDIWALPVEKKVGSISAIKETQTGMVMQLCLQADDQGISLVAGFESGHVAVWRGRIEDSGFVYEMKYMHHTHTQPILGLDVHRETNRFLSSAADALVAKHILLPDETDVNPLPLSRNSKHAGQQGLKIRDDGKIFATAGWDGRVRVYSIKTLAELACLKWHKEGCYSVAFPRAVEIPENASKIDIVKKDDVQDLEASLVLNLEDPPSFAVAKSALPGALSVIKLERERREMVKHWLAVGSKDGKVSLWDIF